MSEDRRRDRPRQVTLGAGFAVGAAAVLVASTYDAMSDLRSVDTRDELAKALGSDTMQGLGITIDQAIGVMHTMLLIGGAAAAAAVVFGIYALRGSSSARTMLGILAAVVLVCSTAMDPLLGLAVAVAASMLWSRPARDWFAGRPVTPPLGAVPAAQGRPASSTLTAGEDSDSGRDPDRPPPSIPPPTPGWGAPEGDPGSQQPWPQQPGPAGQPGHPGAQPPYPPPYGLPPGQGAPYPPGPYAPGPYPPGGYPPEGYQPEPYPPGAYRPGSYPAGVGGSGVPGPVKAAAAITWVFGALALAAFLVTAVVMATNRERVLDLMARQPEYDQLGLDGDALLTGMWVVLAMFVVWTLLAMLFAVFVWRRHQWARILLAVSSAMCVLLALPTLPVSLVHLGAAASVLVLLFTGVSGRWFRGRNGDPGAPGRPPLPPGWQMPGGQAPGGQAPGTPDPGDQQPPSGKPPVW